MRSWIFGLVFAATLLVALGLCVPSVFGGEPAILEPPPLDAAYTPFTIAAFFAMWLTLIVFLLIAEQHELHH